MANIEGMSPITLNLNSSKNEMTFSKTLFEELFDLTLAILLFEIANTIEDSQRELFFKVIRESVKIHIHNLI